MWKLKLFLSLSLLSLVLVGCNLSESVDASTPAKEPTLSEIASPASSKLVVNTAFQQDSAKQIQTCVYPTGWIPYQLQVNENIYTVSTRYGITADALMQGNCFTDPAFANNGSYVYVPPTALTAPPQTILPLGISTFIADPVVAPAGGQVTLVWQAQGSVMNVRAGWLYNGQFIEEMSGLPIAGSIQLPVFNDGRDSMTFMIRISDGIQEVAAQSTVQVTCGEGWFFAPEPAECPTSALVTTFREQRFERGTIVYLPALGELYVMIVGQAAIKVQDEYIPGMPLFDGLYRAPEGFQQANGPIYYIWRKDGIREALGYAIEPETQYQGMLQRTVSAQGEKIYFSASNFHVYQVSRGAAWGVIIPQ